MPPLCMRLGGEGGGSQALHGNQQVSLQSYRTFVLQARAWSSFSLVTTSYRATKHTVANVRVAKRQMPALQ